MRPDVIKLQLVEAGLVECLLEVVTKTVDGESEEDVVQLKTASDLMVLLLLGGEFRDIAVHDREPVGGSVWKQEAQREKVLAGLTSGLSFMFIFDLFLQILQYILSRIQYV